MIRWHLAASGLIAPGMTSFKDTVWPLLLNMTLIEFHLINMTLNEFQLNQLNQKQKHGMTSFEYQYDLHETVWPPLWNLGMTSV